VQIVTRGAGDEDEFVGYDCLWKGLAHPGGLCGVEVFLFSHIVIFFKKGCLIAQRAGHNKNKPRKVSYFYFVIFG
jgi:hypothetical protein